jgi:hypothetical protein
VQTEEFTMSNTATIPARSTATGRPDRLDAIAAADAPDAAVIDLLAPRPAVDISAWRLLTARVPLTLLLDLALPSAEELAELYDELLDEAAPTDWVPSPRPSRER